MISVITSMVSAERVKRLDKSIALIGMPGCGKTSIGRHLAYKLNLPFYDIDEYIANKTGKTIKELFKSGEDYFRDVETQAVKQIAGFGRCIISTGGGIVKRHENMEILSGNSIIVYVKRPLEEIISSLDAESRPLLKDDPSMIYKLYEERHELYKKYSYIEVENTSNIEEAAMNIINAIGSHNF